MFLAEEKKCPYCSASLPKIPARKTKCKSCGQYYYIKKRPPDKVAIIIRENEKSQIDAEWETYYIKNPTLPREFSMINDFISEEEWVQEIKRMLPQGFSVVDVIWSIYNKKLLQAMKLGDLQILQGIYYSMAVFCHKEGKAYFKLLQLSHICELKDGQRLGAKRVLISGSGSSCDKCKPLNGKILTIEEALKTMPIPVKECTTEVFVDGKGFCRCCYLTSESLIEDIENERAAKNKEEQTPKKVILLCSYCNCNLTEDNVFAGICPNCRKLIDYSSVKKND